MYLEFAVSLNLKSAGLPQASYETLMCVKGHKPAPCDTSYPKKDVEEKGSDVCEQFDLD